MRSIFIVAEKSAELRVCGHSAVMIEGHRSNREPLCFQSGMGNKCSALSVFHPDLHDDITPAAAANSYIEAAGSFEPHLIRIDSCVEELFDANINFAAELIA